MAAAEATRRSAPYDEFVKRTFDHMRKGLTEDNTSKKKTGDALDKSNETKESTTLNTYLADMRRVYAKGRDMT